MKKNYIKALLFTSLGFLLAGNVQGQVTIEVTEDAMVRGGTRADDSYPDGVSSTFRVKSNKSDGTRPDDERIAWFKFDLSTYATAVSSATLNISSRENAATTAYLISVSGAEDGWTETTLTFNNQPTIGAEIGNFSTEIGGDTSRYYNYTIDVTDFVNAQIAGDKIVSLAIQDLALTNKALLRILPKGKTSSSGDNPNPASLTIVGGTLGLDDVFSSNLSVYPNPVKNSEELFVNPNSTTTKEVVIYNLLGEKVLEKSTVSKSISLSQLNAGIYLLKVIEEGKLGTKKLIIE